MTVLQLLADFGLVVLIAMIQHIVYPAFHSIGEGSFTDWHKKYTAQITVIVLPLMLAQIALSGYHLFSQFSVLQAIHSALVFSLWVHTFAIAVPLHGQLDRSKNHQLIDRLISANWYRTVAWSLVFVVSLIEWLY